MEKSVPTQAPTPMSTSETVATDARGHARQDPQPTDGGVADAAPSTPMGMPRISRVLALLDGVAVTDRAADGLAAGGLDAGQVGRHAGTDQRQHDDQPAGHARERTADGQQGRRDGRDQQQHQHDAPRRCCRRRRSRTRSIQPSSPPPSGRTATAPSESEASSSCGSVLTVCASGSGTLPSSMKGAMARGQAGDRRPGQAVSGEALLDHGRELLGDVAGTDEVVLVAEVDPRHPSPVHAQPTGVLAEHGAAVFGARCRP